MDVPVSKRFISLRAEYIKYFKAWKATFNYEWLYSNINHDIEFECVPNASFKSYGTKKEISNQYSLSVQKGGLGCVTSFLNRNNITQDETPCNLL